MPRPCCSALHNSTTLGRKLLSFSESNGIASAYGAGGSAAQQFKVRWHSQLPQGASGNAAHLAQGSRLLKTI